MPQDSVYIDSLDTDFEGIDSVNDDSVGIDSVNTTGSVGVDSENTGSLNTDSMNAGFCGIDSMTAGSVGTDSLNDGSMNIDSMNTTGSVGVDSENTGSLNTDSMNAGFCGIDSMTAGSVGTDSVNDGSVGIDSVNTTGSVGVDSENTGSLNTDSMNAGFWGYGMDKKNLDTPNLNENGLNATNLNGHGLCDPDLKECVLNGQGNGHPDQKYVRTLDYLRRLCSMREYCRRDVHDKALKRLEDSEAARKAVDTLVAEKFVDEFRYASAFARDKASIRGWGPLKIRMALSSKGVPRDIIDDALAEIDSIKADDKLRKSLQTKARQLQGDPQLRLKLLRFALSRGHDYDTANSLVRELLSSEDEY